MKRRTFIQTISAAIAAGLIPFSKDSKADNVKDKIYIMVNGKKIGEIQSATFNRTPYRPLGPNIFQNTTAIINRVRFNKKDINRAFANGFFNKNSQIEPIDIYFKQENKKETQICYKGFLTYFRGTTYTTNNSVIVDGVSNWVFEN